MRQWVLPNGNGRSMAIDRRARGMREPRQGTPDARFEQDLARLDVVRRVGLEVFAPAFAHPGLRREVKHVRDTVEQRRQIRMLDRRLREPEYLSQSVRFEAALLQPARVIVG